MMRVDPSARPELWRGGASWSADADGWEAWRLPSSGLHAFDDDDFVEKSRMAAGVRLHTRTDATSIEAIVEYRDEIGSPIDLTVDGELVARSAPAVGTSRLKVDLPEGEHEVVLWMPHFGRTSLRALTVSGASSVDLAPPRARWLAYGSSITHCKRADGPSTTWPALIDRALGWDHINLGFGGQCHLDPPARRAVIASAVDLRLVCAGINLYQSATMSPRGLAPHLGGFLVDVLAAHPGVPLTLVSPIPSPSREHERNAHGVTLAEIREVVESVGAALSDDHPEVTVISGPELLHVEEAADLLPDGLHPGQEGMLVIAQRLAPRLHDARRGAL